jgi:hypothetical protein
MFTQQVPKFNIIINAITIIEIETIIIGKGNTHTIT